MAEGEAMVSGASDGREATGAGMVGGSLPPRKRLLAGMKQNGSWLASSSPASPTTAHAFAHRTEGGGGALGAGAGSAPRNAAREDLTGEAKGGCMSCGAPESDGRVQRFCDFCKSSVNKKSNCCRCQGVYPADAKDPEGWLECCRCHRVVHVECEQRALPQGHGVPYVCSDCVDLKKDEEHVNAAPLSTGAPPVRPGSDSKTESGHRASSPTPAECSNPCKKKLRISKDSRSKSNDVEGDDIGQFEEISNSTKVLLGRKSSSLKEAAAAAAASAAALAGRAAVAAKASAAAKAATAVRAAAVAKAALDAAAVAARVEAQVRRELRRNSISSERVAVGDAKFNATEFQLRKESTEETEVKAEGVGIPAGTKLSSVDDVELARQLHRAINSSPRISSGLTPLRRKPVQKPAVIVNASSHAIVSWPSAESDSRLQMKQQQTRPRSIQLKELKPVDYRDVKLEPKQSGGNSRTKVSQQHDTVTSGNAAAELLALKSEPVDSSAITLARQDAENVPLQSATSAPASVASVKGDGCMNGATAVLCGLEDNQDRVLSANDDSQAAALLDEVLMSEAEKDQEEKDQAEKLQSEKVQAVKDQAEKHQSEKVQAVKDQAEQDEASKGKSSDRSVPESGSN